MSLRHPNLIHAAGSMGATTQVWGAELVLAKTATGTYTCTLDDDADATQCAIVVTMRGGAGQASVAHTSDTVKTITTFAADGITASDRAFDIIILRAPH